jgi:hypothetical protein
VGWTISSATGTHRLKTIHAVAVHRLFVFSFVSLFLVRSFVRLCVFMREGDFVCACGVEEALPLDACDILKT